MISAQGEREGLHADLIVVGGGLAGLTAAALVAREGRSVIVVERAGHLGGRAATQVREGIHFNMGPHALYCAGHAFRLLRELRIPFSGNVPNAGVGLLVGEDRAYPIPRGLRSLLASRLLSLREKWRFLRLMRSLPKLDSRSLDRVPLGDWIARTAGEGGLAALLRPLFRVSTFVADQGRLSAGAALDQFRLGLEGNVWYLDGGWQSLVDGLRGRAEQDGAEVRTGLKAESVRGDEEGVAVTLLGGEVLRGGTAVIAAGPREACDLLDLADDAPLSRWAAEVPRIRAACLDIALKGLPSPETRFALGLERPLYYSVHSASAKLAPEGVAVVQVMKYLVDDGAGTPEAVEGELEAYLDRLQPGWRSRVVERRYLPGMTVSHALPLASDGGLAARPGVTDTSRPNVFLAGDWVGPRGMLADASAASAEEAAGLALAALDRAGARPRRSPSHAIS